jgi:hypothetical protein
LDIIDHRAWSPRGINTTLINEVYAKTKLTNMKEKGGSVKALASLIDEITQALEKVINQPGEAKVQVQRWYPGVVEEITEEVHEKHNTNVTQRLLNEASTRLERKQQIQTMATTGKSVEQILGGMEGMEGGGQPPAPVIPGQETTTRTKLQDVPENAVPAAAPKPKPRRRVRQKMRSTPVVGGGLFGETGVEANDGRIDFFSGQQEEKEENIKEDMLAKWTLGKPNGVSAELVVKGESYNIRISRQTFQDLQKGDRGQMVDSRGIEISGGLNIEAQEDAPIVQRLQGYVRNMPMNKITEEESREDVSEMSSNHEDSSIHES